MYSRKQISFFSVCPEPDVVENTFRSVSETQWLENDVFNYVCNDQLVLVGTAENNCFINEVGILTWSLSRRQNNLPTCGNLAENYTY